MSALGFEENFNFETDPRQQKGEINDESHPAHRSCHVHVCDVGVGVWVMFEGGGAYMVEIFKVWSVSRCVSSAVPVHALGGQD